MAGQAPHQVPNGETHAFTADRGDDRVRLDRVLSRHLGGSHAASRTRLQQAIADGDVTLNNVVVTRASAKVTAGDRIEARLHLAAIRNRPAPQQMPLEVLFEDGHLLAVNKPPGIVVHPCYKHPDATVLNAVLWHLADGLADGDSTPRLIHRLDKDTSGVLLVSKTRQAHAAITRAMHAGQVRKEYLAIVCGVPSPPTGRISLALSRDPGNVRRVAVVSSQGKESVTKYETLCRTREAGGRLSLVRCELVTGRMHQVRVHLAARGWPIAGDSVYGGIGRPDFPRHALHAWRLSLGHPVTGEPLVIVAPVPQDMRAVMADAGLRAPS